MNLKSAFTILIAVSALVVGTTARAERAATGADELFRRGVEALQAERYADAASMFRLSYTMQPRAETQCNLGLTYERWGGHDPQAVEAYERCAADDREGRFRQHAMERASALRLRMAAAAAGSVPAAAASNLPRGPVGSPTPASPGGMPIRITWGNVRRTSGCFFFSGPGRLGRNDQLADEAVWSSAGDLATLTFAGGQTFTGVRRGPTVELTRRATYSSGGTWIVTETIRGTFQGSVLVATYHYDECNSGRPSSCPGNCHIDAQVTARPR